MGMRNRYGAGGLPWQAGPLPLCACVARTVGSALTLLLVLFSPTDVLSLQSQDKVHKKIQHPEVPQDPGASYPSGRGMGTGAVVGGRGGLLQAPLCPFGSLT